MLVSHEQEFHYVTQKKLRLVALVVAPELLHSRGTTYNKSGMKYITTPIYYVNGTPHIGSALTTLAADVLARFWRIKNGADDVFFLTGTDEHGAKIAETAQKAGKDPQTFADEISQEFEAAWKLLNIEPDGFIRTTNAAHKKYVQTFLQDLYDKGHIYKGEYTGWYCVGCEEFKTSTQIGENNTCPIHLTPLTELSEEAYHFKLSAFETQIKEAIESGAFAIEPAERKNEALAILNEGLRDVAISRKNVAWGVTLPWDESHTVYVWVDALLNYLSAAEGDVFTDKKPVFPPSLQLVGKDILRFHALIWPGLLIAGEKPFPEKLFIHGFFTVEGQKMSKSLGNQILPQELVDRYGVDGARYLLLSAVPFGSDGDITRSRLDLLYNAALANNFGNLISRVQAMLVKYNGGLVPSTEEKFLNVSVGSELSALKINDAIEKLDLIIDALNVTIEQRQPWKLSGEERDNVMSYLAEAIFRLGYVYAPFLPATSAKILAIFGSSIAEINYDTLNTSNHTAGKTIQPCEPLFPRLESES